MNATRNIIAMSAAALAAWIAPQAAGAGGGDFNGDGFADLAIGASFESVGGIANTGAVHVLYGTSSGLDTAGAQHFHQNSPGIADQNEANDGFGTALAVGDFDGDGFDDLAIGAPFETINGMTQAGAVHVLYGSANGLSAAGSQLWTQNTSGIADSAEPGDAFGYSLIAGDFNHDGNDDLAIGAPFEDLFGMDDAGAVHVLYGRPAGLRATQSQFWNLNSTGILGEAEPADFFGQSLISGDFDGNGVDDLAIGAPNKTINGQVGAGTVSVIYGRPHGLAPREDQLLRQGAGGVANAAEAFDHFGAALAAGDFNGDGYDDLAIGAPFEDIDGVADAGGVNVIYGSNDGLRSHISQFWHQNTGTVRNVAEDGDQFGATLVAGSFNGGRFDDLAIGVPQEDLGAGSNAGGVHVLYGSFIGLRSGANQFWKQSSPDILEQPEENDLFGSALASGDFDNDGADDLAIGAHVEDVDDAVDAGAVHVIYGERGRRLTADGNQLFTRDLPEIAGQSNFEDAFGFSLGK